MVAQPLTAPPVPFPAGTHHLVSVISLSVQYPLPETFFSPFPSSVCQGSCANSSGRFLWTARLGSHIINTLPFSTSHKSKLFVCKTISPSGFRVGSLPSSLWFSKINDYVWSMVCVCVCARVSHSVVSESFVTPWTGAHQAPLSTGFPRQEYWSGLPFSSPRDLPNPGTETQSPALQADSYCLNHQGSLVSVRHLINLFE